MKKITTLFLILATAASLYAQDDLDALTFAQDRYEGTARSMAMGNAFTALGGDLGGLGINPAASGVYHCSQFAITPSLTGSRSAVNYLGNLENSTNTAPTLSNLGFVLSFDTGNYSGLLNYNFGFVYNKKNNFRSSVYARGTTEQSSMLGAYASRLNLFNDDQGWFTDINSESLEAANAYSTYSDFFWPAILAWRTYGLAPFYTDKQETNYIYMASTENYDGGRIHTGGPLNQLFKRKTYGGIEEFSFNFGGNVGDFMYFGVNLNIHTLNRTIEDYYEEKAKNSSDFQDGFRSMDNSYWLHTSGSGANLKFGIILTPIGGLRLGATFTTPTRYSLTDEWNYTMNMAFNNNYTATEFAPGPSEYEYASYSYKLTTPLRWSIGAAYTFWDRALLSVDYERVNYSKLFYSNQHGAEGDFADINRYMKDNLVSSSIIRAGAEFRVNWLISLRGGYQYYNHYGSEGLPMHIYSAGIGFNIGQRTSIDLAWVRTKCAESFQLYGNYLNYDNGDVCTAIAPVGTNNYGLGQLACTFALKF